MDVCASRLYGLANYHGIRESGWCCIGLRGRPVDRERELEEHDWGRGTGYT